MKLRAFFLSLALSHSVSASSDSSLPFDIESITAFDEPWAMAFLPDERILVTEKKGQLMLVDQDGEKTCLLYTSPSPRDGLLSRMPSSA